MPGCGSPAGFGRTRAEGVQQGRAAFRVVHAHREVGTAAPRAYDETVTGAQHDRGAQAAEPVAPAADLGGQAPLGAGGFEGVRGPAADGPAEGAEGDLQARLETFARTEEETPPARARTAQAAHTGQSVAAGARPSTSPSAAPTATRPATADSDWSQGLAVRENQTRRSSRARSSSGVPAGARWRWPGRSAARRAPRPRRRGPG